MTETTVSQLSTETRQKISDSMKANWAGGRKRTLSKEVKDKIAASQSARWAKQREAVRMAAAAFLAAA